MKIIEAHSENPLCLHASNMRTAAAFETFIESIFPRMGITMVLLAMLIQVSDNPVDSVPMMIAEGPVKSILW